MVSVQEWQPKKAARCSPAADRKDARDLLSEACDAEPACPLPVDASVRELRTPSRSGTGRADKLKRKSEFDEVKASGLKWNDPLFTFLAVPASCEEGVRCGIICSRRFDKRAVVRNRARRLLWEAFRLLKADFPPCRFLLIPRRKICTENMNVVREHLNAVLPWLKRKLEQEQKHKSDSLSPSQESC
ncbi:MAG: ribonuclease P protein component [Lentisphaerae bacterium]|nr:ribonuclease P protein component [Lentisphaerota bacterium]